MLRVSRRRIRVIRYRPPLLLATFFCAIAVSAVFGPGPLPPGPIRESGGPLGQCYRHLQNHRDSAGRREPAAAPRDRRSTTTPSRSLRDIQADYVRYVPWLPYPKLAVAELEPPANGKTSWDFSLIDPMTIDFLDATKGHSVILNFSTIPQWMFKTDKPVTYPADPDQPVWDYTQGTEPRDPSMKEIGDYYGRLFSWYTQGGFTDEFGKRHESGYHYSIPYWEVLNEIEFEHQMTPETYTEDL